MNGVYSVEHNARVRTSALACYLFLLPMFMSTFEVNPAGIKQSTYLQFALYPLLLSLARAKEVIAGILALASILAFNSIKERCGTPSEAIIESSKLGLYFMAAITAARAAAFDDFYRAIIKLATLSAALVIACFVLNFTTGFSVLADGGYGKVRPHALVSEPSAMAIPLALLSAAAVQKNSYPLLALALGAAAMTQSVIVGLLSFIALCLSFLLKISNARLSVISFLIGGFAFVTFIGNPDNFAFLAGISPRLHSGLLAIATGGEAGHNPRFITTQIVLEQLRDTGTLATGLGIEINSCLNREMQWGYDASLAIFFIRSCGYLGLVVLCTFLLASAYRAAKIFDSNGSMIFIFIAIVMFGVFLNGAQGLLYFTLLGALCFFAWNNSLKSKPTHSSTRESDAC